MLFSFVGMSNLQASSVLMITDWRKSGKSKRLYCREHGINPSTFYYWFSRVKKEEEEAVGFVTIEKPVPNKTIEITYPNGVRLRVENDLALVSQLIHLC